MAGNASMQEGILHYEEMTLFRRWPCEMAAEEIASPLVGLGKVELYIGREPKDGLQAKFERYGIRTAFLSRSPML